MILLRWLGTAIFRLDRCVTTFELWFAQYRMDRIDKELTTEVGIDFQEVFARKSNIQAEIHRIRCDLASADYVIERMS